MAARPAALAPGSGVEFWRYAITKAGAPGPMPGPRTHLAPRPRASRLARASHSQKA